MGKLDLSAKEYRDSIIGIINELVSFLTDERMTELQAFTYSYDQSKVGRISFCLDKDNKGRNIDKNLEFRDEVALFIISNYTSQVPSELLRDIYIEAAKCSEILNGSPEYIPFIVEFLFRRIGEKFIEDFCMYLTSSFDFYGACISIDLYEYDVSPFICTIEDLMKECKSEEGYKKLDHGREFLQRYI